MSSGSSDLRTVWWLGLRTVAPILLGVIPFGLVVGYASVEADLGLIGAWAFSVLVFSGAAQITSITLLDQGAPVIVCIVSALVISVRMMMYSASIAPWLAQVPLRLRLLMSHGLIDQTYAVSIIAYRQHEQDWGPRERVAYFASGAFAMFSVWQITTTIGALAGGIIPDSVPLAFAIPLVFLCMLVPAVIDRATLVAALVGGTVATLGVGLPSNLGMPLAALLGVAAGTAVATYQREQFGQSRRGPS